MPPLMGVGGFMELPAAMAIGHLEYQTNRGGGRCDLQRYRQRIPCATGWKPANMECALPTKLKRVLYGGDQGGV